MILNAAAVQRGLAHGSLYKTDALDLTEEKGKQLVRNIPCVQVFGLASCAHIFGRMMANQRRKLRNMECKLPLHPADRRLRSSNRQGHAGLQRRAKRVGCKLPCKLERCQLCCRSQVKPC